MARIILGSLLDRDFRNNLNGMLLELYEGIGTATGTKNKIDAFLDGTGVVTRKMIANNSVDTTKIADGAVDELKIADDSVTNSKIQNGAVSGSKLSLASVYEDKIADNSIPDGKMKEKTVGSRELKDGSVTNSKLGTRSITWDKLDEGAVTSSRLADDSVGTAKIEDGAVTNDKIAEGAITNSKITNNAVRQEHIMDIAIRQNHIAGSAVTTSKIENGAVTQGKLADGAVNRVKLSDGAVDNSKLDDRVYGRNLTNLTNINDIEIPGIYTERIAANAQESLGYPPGNQAGVLDVRDMGAGVITQIYTMTSKGQIWTRRRYLGNWSEWLKVGNEVSTTLTLGNKDLNEMLDSGEWKQITSSAATIERNYPNINSSEKFGVLNVVSYAGAVMQTYLAERSAELFVRNKTIAGVWSDWKLINSSDNDQEELKTLPMVEMELTGKWTPNDDGDRFILEMGKHELVETIEIGRSVHDRPIYAAIIGDKTKPALLVNAGAHGTEVGPPEGAWLWVRELTENKNLMFMDICIIVVPNQNPDNRFNARGNKNGVDLNRDWIERAQPETQAVESLLNDYNVVSAVDVHNFGYPRQTSLQEATYGLDVVKNKSQELYDTVFNALESDSQPVRRYAPEVTENSFLNGIASVDGIPTLIVEIPCGGYNDWTFDHYMPTPRWQAHIFMLSCNAIANYVWENLSDFEAVKSEEIQQ